MNNIDILEEPKDILFEIDMKLYDEFNDKFCEIEENLGTVYSYKDLEDLKKAESDTERALLRKAISTLIAENKELKEKNKELDKFIKEGITIEPNNPYKNFQLNYLRENFIPKSKVVEELKKAISEEIDTSKAMFEGDFTNGYIFALQSLLGKE